MLKNLTPCCAALMDALGRRWAALLEDSNLVDPASSHMLVSKTKPCMSKYSDIQRNCEWHIKTVIVYMIIEFTWITVVILELIHAG